MATNNRKKPKKRYRRVKFPLSRRERLKQLAPEDYTLYKPTLSRLGSLHSVVSSYSLSTFYADNWQSVKVSINKNIYSI